MCSAALSTSTSAPPDRGALLPARYGCDARCPSRPVPELLSRAELASVGGALVSVESIDAVSAAARRLLGVAEAAFRDHQVAGFPGCLHIWEVGRAVLQPLLQAHGRGAGLMAGAMRA